MELPHEQCNYPHCDCGSMDFCLQARMASEEHMIPKSRKQMNRFLWKNGIRFKSHRQKFVNSKQSWRGAGWCDVCEGYANDLLVNTQGVGICEPCLRSPT